jgi:5-(carboxyamino)imidazole ribonucleotide synthase
VTIGVLGGGQLGRMMALAGYPLGQRFIFLDPGAESCAGHVGDLRVGAYDDIERLAELSRRADVITYEFENVPVASARYLAERVAVYPPPAALEVSQDRIVEKNFLVAQGIPTPAFAAVDSAEDMAAAIAKVGLPAVTKTRRFGYDGKGQIVLRTEADAARAFEALGAAPLIVEAFVPFDAEVSILAVRGKGGDKRFYPLTQNEHQGGILRYSRPATPLITDAMQASAQAHATRVLDALGYVGVLAIEFFVHQGALVANEMAPRVHNSGHWTIEGAETSQFDNHVRAITGLPLGSTALRGPVAMLNVIGRMPDRGQVLQVPGAHLHSYGKDGAPGRKVGHLTITAPSVPELEARVQTLRARLVS